MTSLASPINHMLWEAVSGPYTHLPKKYMVKTSSLSLRDNGGYDSLKACNFFGHASCRGVMGVTNDSQRIGSFGEFRITTTCQAWVNLSTVLTVDGRS